MAIPPKPRREESGTYAIQDRSSKEELERLLIDDQMFTASLGGILPEQLDPTRFQRVLDVGCGPGGWILEMAKTYPDTSLLVGVDITPKMLNYARTKARGLHLDNRIEFRQMDALCPLDFPNEYFDLVNERFGASWLRTWDWPRFLQECQRVTRPSGVIRITEFSITTESSSLALARLSKLMIEAFYRAGHIFTPESDGLIKELPHLFSRNGIQNVQTRPHVLEYRAGTRGGQLFAEDWKRLYRGIVPFLRKWTHVPDDYEDIYRQMLNEMQRPDFVVVTHLLTVWGTRPPKFSSPMQR